MPQKDKNSKRYYVVVDSQRLGPFDRRTITGMRVKKVLHNESQIHDEQGNYTTVIELLGYPTPVGPSTGGTEIAGVYHPSYEVTLLKPQTRNYGGLDLRGKGEIRILGDVLRIAGLVKTSFLSRGEPSRVRMPHWHLEQLDRNGVEITLFSPPYISQEYNGSVRMKFRSVDEAMDFETQVRQVMPWVI